MNVLVKILGLGASIGAGFVANKVLTAAWKKSTGKNPPTDGTDLDDSLIGVLSFALVSAATGAVVHVLTQRGTKHALVKLQRTGDEV